MTQKPMRWLAAGAALAMSVIAAAQAQDGASQPVATQSAELRIMSAASTVGEADELLIGVEFVLDEGWHIYWRSPGDFGLPPNFDWSASDNVAAVEIEWPLPLRLNLLGLQALAYADQVVFPMQVALERPGEPVALRASVDFLICADICVPDSAELALDIPAGPAAPTRFAQIINQAEATVPGDGAAIGLGVAGVEVEAAGEADGVLRVQVSSALALAAPDVFVDAPASFSFGPPTARVAADGLSATVELPYSVWDGDPAALADAALTLTVHDGARAMEQALVPASYNPEAPPAALGAAPAAAAAEAPTAELVAILLTALLGGLILNLMPCVLPVLGLKVMSFVGHGGGKRGHVRASFVASAAGIVFSFLVLAAAAVGLRIGGVAVGWGMQFQQPIFLAVMLVIVSLFAFNMFGLFEIRLPRRIADLAGSVGGHGASTTLRGHFATGVFATLLATPCSAPFVGAALGFALSRGSFEIVAVFATMGLGLALPYLLIAAFPGLATRLPKPGRWMVWARRALGLALAATGVWIASILETQIGLEGAAGVAALVLLVGAPFAVRRWLPGARIGRLAPAAATALAAAAIMASAFQERQVDASSAYDDLIWIAFDRDAIPGYVAAGQVVFVDVTADWCITCIYNKRAVMNVGEVARILASGAVVAMRADWTNPDPAIADYLASFGRYGIPFDVIYGPGAPEGVTLPELLSESAVLDALAQAGDGDMRLARAE